MPYKTLANFDKTLMIGWHHIASVFNTEWSPIIHLNGDIDNDESDKPLDNSHHQDLCYHRQMNHASRGDLLAPMTLRLQALSSSVQIYIRRT